MRIAICHVSDAARTRVQPALQLTDATTAQFGTDTVVLGDDVSWPAVQEAADRGGIRLEELRVASVNDLHVVVQSGRSFQHQHQDVRVLLDKGRILLVDLDQEQATSLANRPDARAHYGIRPLLDDVVVFETRERPAARSAPVPWVQALVDRVSPISFRADLSHLAAFPTRFSDSAHYATASLWAQEQLSAMGYAARRENISADGRESFNVIAERPGSGPDHRSLVIVTAHLDSINEEGPAEPAPGADDNASGSAGLL